VDHRYSVQPSLSVDDSFSRPLSRYLKTMHDVSQNDLAASMEQVVRSVVSEETRDGLRTYGYDPFDVRIAVMVQEEVSRRISGSVFSCDPMTGKDGIVSEMMSGDDQGRWPTPSRRISTKTGRQGNSLLPDVTQAELEDAVRLTSRKLRSPIWMEFVYDGDRIWYLRLHEIESLRDLRIFSREIPSRQLPGITTPMVWSVIAPLGNSAWEDTSKRSLRNKAAASAGVYRLITGRVYSDVSFLPDGGVKVPSPVVVGEMDRMRKTHSGLQRFEELALEEMGDDELVLAGQTLMALVSETLQYDISEAFRTWSEVGVSSLESGNGYDFSRPPYADREHEGPDAGKSEVRDSMECLRASTRGSLRRYYLEIGRRMVAKQVLLSADDVFYLNADEVAQILAGGCEGNQCNNYRLRAFMRRSELGQQAALILPDVIYGEVVPPGRGATDRAHQGIGVCSGYFQGRARWLTDPGRAGSPGGEVVIVPDAGPDWIQAIKGARAIIASSGGLMSPLSVAARELQVPAVVALEKASGIKDGTMVTVDGFTGMVYAGTNPL
jgi:phosphohistidine swiveling domain-containing protein